MNRVSRVVNWKGSFTRPLHAAGMVFTLIAMASTLIAMASSLLPPTYHILEAFQHKEGR